MTTPDTAEKIAEKICNSLNKKYDSNYFSEIDLVFIETMLKRYADSRLEEAAKLVDRDPQCTSIKIVEEIRKLKSTSGGETYG